MDVTRQHPDQRKGWLLWTALIILLVGGTISFLLHRQGLHPDARKAFGIALGCTVVGVGICLICASSNWWMRR